MSAGDVAMAYDLNFTNSAGSNINSAGPLAINAGEVFGSSNLTLQTYNSGKLILNSSNLYNDGTNFGVGTTNPTEKLEINGNLKFASNPTIKWNSNTLSLQSVDSIGVIAIKGSTSGLMLQESICMMEPQPNVINDLIQQE